MSEKEKEKNPKLVLKNLPINGDGVKVKLDSEKCIASGKGEYGNWYLWIGFVNNFTVEGEKGKDIPNYSGKVIFFAKDSLNKKLEEVANGNKSAEVMIKFNAQRNQKGQMTQFYSVDLLGEEKLSLTPTEQKIVDDLRKFRSSGFVITEQSFVDSTQSGTYADKISVERARELFKTYFK